MPKRSRFDRKAVLDAIRRAARELGRSPSWGELRRITGVPESRVRAYFPSLAEAVRAAGLDPGHAGLRIPTQDLLADFSRVEEKLGHRPSRNEYLREGRYSAGAYYARFGSWNAIGQPGFAINEIKEDAAELNGRSRQSSAVRVQAAEERPADKAIAVQWAGAVAALPGELAGKRRVTDAVCAMIVNTLMGDEAGRKWRQVMMGEAPDNYRDRRDCQDYRDFEPAAAMVVAAASASSLAAPAPVNGHGAAALAHVNGSISSGGILDGELPVMGPPFNGSALTNAPINEVGVVFLFGMLAGELGFQVESLRGQFPDCEARRQIQPGKWQRVRIEFEYESRNFAQHGHDPAACDLIVCWKHNWGKCPASIEVIALSELIARAV